MVWIESIPLAALVCDAHGIVLAANRLAEQRLERPRSELVGRARADFEPQAEVPLAEGALLLFSDGPALERLQQQVWHLARLASAGRLVSVVVHEINNALSGILGYAQFLLAKELPPAVQRDLGRIHDEALRTARVAQNLLRFSRAGIGERAPFSLGELVERCAELKRRDYLLRSIRLELELPADLPAVHGDETLVSQVLINLLTNAHQSIASVRDQGRVRVRAGRSGEQVVLYVEDDGPGIPPELRTRVFEPFFSRRADGTGTGLGLALCRDIMREHGGEIAALDGELPGACLRLAFPAHSGAAQPRSPTAATVRAPAVALRDRRIVVIEDEPALRELFTRAFAGHGNRTVVFERGEDALAHLLTEPVDLIVSDVHRPGLDGPELYRRLRGARPALLQRLLFVTGDVVSPEVAGFLARTRARCLKKPLQLDRLVEEARAIVERPDPQGELFEAGA